MGRRGPTPAPPGVKRAKGETRPSRVNYEAPVPRQGKPRAPDDMKPYARKVWQHVLREMPEGVIAKVDQYALRAYCESVMRYVEAQHLLQESTVLVRQGGRVAKNPLHQVVRDNADQMRMWARELGLTPAARASLQLEGGATPAGIAAELGLPPRLRSVG